MKICDITIRNTKIFVLIIYSKTLKSADRNILKEIPIKSYSKNKRKKKELIKNS